MHRLEDRTILVIGLELLDERLSGATGIQASRDQGLGVGTPLTKIVVDIDRRNSGATASLPQFREMGRHR